MDDALRRSLDGLSVTDPEARETAYESLSERVHGGEAGEDDLREILREAAQRLGRGLGERGADSVFGRSYAALAIALVLVRDGRRPFLAEDEWRAAAEGIVDYCRREEDLRALVPGQGWAHAAAHAADAVDELALCRFAGVDDCRALFEGLASLLTRAEHVYDAEEDERIATALDTISGRVGLDRLVEWLDAEAASLDLTALPTPPRINWKHAVRSLSLRVRHDERLLAVETRLSPLAAG